MSNETIKTLSEFLELVGRETVKLEFKNKNDDKWQDSYVDSFLTLCELELWFFKYDFRIKPEEGK